MNMSYCRFRNTRMDFEACVEAIEYGDEISAEEKYAAEKLYRLCKRYMAAYEEWKAEKGGEE